MAGKAKARGKKKSARVAKPAPVTRKRRVGRPVKAADPVLVLREHRERLAALFQEAQKVHEVTLEGIRRLVETTTAHTRSVSEQIAEEVEKLDAHCRKLKEQHGEAIGEGADDGGSVLREMQS
jgi:hypothetical protein